MLVVMAIMVIYIVLGVLYESFIHPITILSGLPSAGFGALLALECSIWRRRSGWISPLLDLSLDIYGFVGIIMLIGIVKKNAIMMIDFALGCAAQTTARARRKRSIRAAWSVSVRS